MMMIICSTAVALIFIIVAVGWYTISMVKLRCRSSDNKGVPRNWAVVGMMPALLKNVHRVHEFATDVLRHSGGTFEFKGPAAFDSLSMLVTSDPANIHHILSKNFSNYPKGPHFRKIFDILGDGVVNVDSHLWEFHRKTTLSFLNHAQFYTLLETNVWHKVEKGLLPVLDWFAEEGVEFDLQEVFQRFTFDTISMLILHHDPQSLCLGLPYVPCEKAFNHAADALLYRHIFPESCWKLQNWLGIGKEKKLIQACRAFDGFIYSAIKRLEERMMMITTKNNNNNDSDDDLSLFTAYVQAYKQQEQLMAAVLTTTTTTAAVLMNKFLRDSFLTLMLAGRDTTSTALTWLFYLLAQNPLVLAKVRHEIENKLNLKQEDKRFFKVEECHKLVYLHAALCESLRLFPPVAIEHKVSAGMDVLPSGHLVKPNTRILLLFYSSGRMDSIWGEGCMEFKPERWISGNGRIKHEPSYKFPAFNAGPRTCIGKQMSFVQMKMIILLQSSCIIMTFKWWIPIQFLPVIQSSFKLNKA